MSLLYNPATKTQLDMLRVDTPHALLLTGEPGVGLGSVAREIAGKNLIHFLLPTSKDGEPDQKTGTIAVDRIRELYDMTKGKSSTDSFVVIDDADRMRESAQNAFLKLLEEPNPTTHFILTSHKPERLLPTILSRVQTVPVKRITAEQTESLLSQIHDPQKKKQLQFLAAGLPAELHRLMKDDAYFTMQSKLIRDAQALLGGDRWSRIKMVYEYASNREQALQLLEAAKLIIRHSLSSKPAPAIVMQADLLADTMARIEGMANVRLQLLRLVV